MNHKPSRHRPTMRGAYHRRAPIAAILPHPAPLVKGQEKKNRTDPQAVTGRPAGQEKKGRKTMTATITTNTAKKSIEIAFDGKPAAEVREALKGLRFRWNPTRGIWYGFADEQTTREAIENAEKGATVTTAKEPTNRNAAKPPRRKPHRCRRSGSAPAPTTSPHTAQRTKSKRQLRQRKTAPGGATTAQPPTISAST